MSEPFPFQVGNRVRVHAGWSSSCGQYGTVAELPHGLPQDVGVTLDNPVYLGDHPLRFYCKWYELEMLEEGEG